MKQDALNNNLLSAAKNGEIEQVNALISLGANINAVDESGKTPLYLAIEKDKTGVALYLIEKRADLKLADKDNWGPLHIATCKANTKVVEALIKKGVTEENPKLSLIKIAFIGYLATLGTILPDDTASLEDANKKFKEVCDAITKGKADVNLDKAFFINIIGTINKHGMRLDENGKEAGKFLGEQLKKINKEAAAEGLLMLDASKAKGGSEQNAGSSTSPATSTAELTNTYRMLMLAMAEFASFTDVLKAIGISNQNAGPSASPSSTSSGKRGAENLDNEGPSKKNTGLGGKGA